MLYIGFDFLTKKERRHEIAMRKTFTFIELLKAQETARNISMPEYSVCRNNWRDNLLLCGYDYMIGYTALP